MTFRPWMKRRKQMLLQRLRWPRWANGWKPVAESWGILRLAPPAPLQLLKARRADGLERRRSLPELKI